MTKKRKPREWYAVVSCLNNVRDVCDSEDDARAFCREHNSEPQCGRPFKVIKVREVLARRKSK